MVRRQSDPFAVPYWQLSSFYFFYFALLGGTYPYWPLYLKSVGFNAEKIGLLLAIPLITKVLAPNIWSWFADSTGRRLRIVQLGSLLGLICFTGVLIDQSFGWLVIVMASYSFFWNAVLPQHEVITLNFLGNQPERYSRLRLWGSIGFIVFVVAAGLLFERVGIEVFPWLGIVCMASIFISSLHIPVPLNEGARIKRGSLWSSARQSAVLSFLLAGTLLQVAHGAYYSFFSIYMAELGYTSFAIGMLWSLGVIAEVVIFIFMHNLLLSVGIRTVLITSLLFAVLRWILIAKGAHIVWLLVFAQCLHAFTFGTFHAAAIDTIRRLFKPESQGGGQALYSAVSLGIGGAVGSCLAGLYWQEGAEFVFIVASALCGAAVVIAWFGFRDTRLA